MAIFDTTNSLDTSMLMKSRLPKNMVGENYYIENLQEKRNQDWQYRYNVVDIEEEIRMPILFYETIEGEQGEFIIICDNMAYRYVIGKQKKFVNSKIK